MSPGNTPARRPHRATARRAPPAHPGPHDGRGRCGPGPLPRRGRDDHPYPIAVLTIFSGAGIPLYLAELLLLIPERQPVHHRLAHRVLRPGRGSRQRAVLLSRAGGLIAGPVLAAVRSGGGLLYFAVWLPVGAGNPVTTVDWVFSPGPRQGKSGIWLRGGHALRHPEYSCRYDSPTSRCSECSAGSPCSPAPSAPRTRRS
jgi:hypothetical protein